MENNDDVKKVIQEEVGLDENISDKFEYRKNQLLELLSKDENSQSKMLIIEETEERAGSPSYTTHSYTPISGKMELLIKNGFFKPIEGHEAIGPASPGSYPDMLHTNLSFKNYEDCDSKQQQEILEYDQKIENIKNSKEASYDKEIQVIIKDYTDNNSYPHNHTISISPRQLAQDGILFSDLKTVEQNKQEKNVSSSDISKATKDLTVKKISFIRRLFDKLLGKGER